MNSVSPVCSPQTDREKDPDYDSLPSQTSQSESSMLQVICRPEATNKEDAYTFHTVHSKQPSERKSTVKMLCNVVCTLKQSEMSHMQQFPDQFEQSI